MKRFSLSLMLALLWAAPALAQGELDVITLADGGAAKRGKIVEAQTNKDAVAIEINTVVTKVETNNVKRINFTDAPPLLRAAEVSISAGQLEDAVEKLKQINLGDVQRDIVGAEVSYNLAFCMAKMALAGSGNVTTNQAAAAMKKFADDEKSLHYYQANEIMGDLASSLGNAAAATFYAKVAEAPWPDYKMRSAVLEGQALLLQKKPKDAYTKFESVITSTLNTPVATRQKEFASLGKAKCLADAAPPQPDQGVALAEKIIAEGDSRDGDLFSRAYNSLGYCHMKAGRPKDALLAYLHVDLMFYQDPSQHAEALHHLQTLWREANKADKALRARNILKERYAGSVWAK